jgi:hypothetical protein
MSFSEKPAVSTGLMPENDQSIKYTQVYRENYM